MEQAIKKAIEGGYNLNRAYLVSEHTTYEWGVDEKSFICRSKMLLDPLFWSCLGKSLGWADKVYHDEYNKGGFPSMFEWQIKWHRFIDHLAEGKDPESFFNELLK